MHKSIPHIIITLIICSSSSNTSANFIWPTVGRECGLYHHLFLLSIIFGLFIEFLFLKKMLPQAPTQRIALMTLAMNITSAAFGILLFSVTNISLNHLIGIAWFWNETVLYSATIICNVIVESAVCVRMMPTISRQPLIFYLLFANAISVGMSWLAITFKN